MDRVFVYLMDGENPICFWKGSVSDFNDPNPKAKWLNMKADKAIDKVDKEYEAGMIQFKMSVHETTDKGPVNFSSYDAWKKPIPRQLMAKRIRCYIF